MDIQRFRVRRKELGKRYFLKHLTIAAISLFTVSAHVAAAIGDQPENAAETAAPAVFAPTADTDANENWAWHVQATNVTQYHPNFS